MYMSNYCCIPNCTVAYGNSLSASSFFPFFSLKKFSFAFIWTFNVCAVSAKVISEEERKKPFRFSFVFPFPFVSCRSFALSLSCAHFLTLDLCTLRNQVEKIRWQFTLSRSWVSHSASNRHFLPQSQREFQWNLQYDASSPAENARLLSINVSLPLSRSYLLWLSIEHWCCREAYVWLCTEHTFPQRSMARIFRELNF